MGLFFRFSVAVEIRSGVGGHPLARLALFCPSPARASPAGPGLRRREEEMSFGTVIRRFASLYRGLALGRQLRGWSAAKRLAEWLERVRTWGIESPKGGNFSGEVCALLKEGDSGDARGAVVHAWGGVVESYASQR